MDLVGVLRAAQAADPASVADLVAAAARDFGGSDVVAYLVDFEQLVLEPLPDRGTHADVPEAQTVASTMAGRAFLTWSEVVRPLGFEPRTCGLRVRCSAIELEARRQEHTTLRAQMKNETATG